MDSIADLLRKVHKDAYLEGRKDGLDGLHIEPQLVFNSYIAEGNASKKLSELGYIPDLVLCESANG